MNPTTFCAAPRQCPLQHQCKKNADNHRGTWPQQIEWRLFVSPPDGECPGFEPK